MLDVQIKSIKMTPTKFDDDSLIVKEAFATVSLDIPLDSDEQKELVVKMMECLSCDYVKAEIVNPQTKLLPKAETDDTTETETEPEGNYGY